jgi:hypothetical protein
VPIPTRRLRHLRRGGARGVAVVLALAPCGATLVAATITTTGRAEAAGAAEASAAAGPQTQQTEPLPFPSGALSLMCYVCGPEPGGGGGGGLDAYISKSVSRGDNPELGGPYSRIRFTASFTASPAVTITAQAELVERPPGVDGYRSGSPARRSAGRSVVAAAPAWRISTTWTTRTTPTG